MNTMATRICVPDCPSFSVKFNALCFERGAGIRRLIVRDEKESRTN